MSILSPLVLEPQNPWGIRNRRDYSYLAPGLCKVFSLRVNEDPSVRMHRIGVHMSQNQNPQIHYHSGWAALCGFTSGAALAVKSCTFCVSPSIDLQPPDSSVALSERSYRKPLSPTQESDYSAECILINLIMPKIINNFLCIDKVIMDVILQYVQKKLLIIPK